MITGLMLTPLLFLMTGFGTQTLPLAVFVTVTGAAFGAGIS